MEYFDSWTSAKDRLVDAVEGLGFPAELGLAVAKNLGSPRAMSRMIVYLENVRPKTAEMVVDEMLSICAEIEAWREQKAVRDANSRYNEFRYFGPEWEKDEEEEPE